ncbi:GDP-mannose 4,6-dehydratase [Paenibacillus pedocola]|uniref:GDP-mannose 4,6-dehydratase n=1 Tax=Paenibacillus pedocola TaxID=3242193 RepID=UPI0028774DA6|nr:GDP-mannose 4,6-dehydratase [Paenibacillus typhae]
MMQRSLSDCRALVTGASGFIGAWLTRHLVDQGAEVTTILSEFNPRSQFAKLGLDKEIRCYYGYITDYNLIERAITDGKINTVFHLAAVSLQDLAYQIPWQTFETNVKGTYNLLEACRVHQDQVSKIIVASSDKVYGDSPILPYYEDMPIQGRNPYDVSKACSDLISQSYRHSFNLPIAVGRFGNIYGGGDLNYRRLIPGTVQRLYAKLPPVIRIPSNGIYMRDFLYIQDLVAAYMAMYHFVDKEGKGDDFNFGTGKLWDIKQVIEIIQRAMNLEHIEPLYEHQKNSEILHQHLSPEKAKFMLNWSAETSLEEGIRNTVEWYCNYWNPDDSNNPVLGIV